jgi:hypothetical protein
LALALEWLELALTWAQAWKSLFPSVLALLLAQALVLWLAQALVLLSVQA